jgi:cold shock CspA family protein
LSGVVESFDEAVGLGTVWGDDGVAYPFHCTQILGGGRTIAAGSAVTFEVVPGGLGRWEAAAVAPAGATRRG